MKSTLTRLIPFLVIFCLFFISCEEGEMGMLSNFNGITEIAVDGQVLRVDSRDWSGRDTYGLNTPPQPPDSITVQGDSSGGHHSTLPTEYCFYSPACPNPSRFIPVTITIGTPQAGSVEVNLIDKSGSVVASLYSGMCPAGAHSFKLSPLGISPGLYRVVYKWGDAKSWGDVEIRSQTAVNTDYIGYMQQHWCEEAYHAYIDSTYGIAFNEEEFGWYTLPPQTDDIYHELIGESNQFTPGWDDFVPDTTYETYGASVHQGDYLDLWRSAYGN